MAARLAESGEEFRDDFRRALPADALARLQTISDARATLAVATSVATAAAALVLALWAAHPFVSVLAIVLIGSRQHAFFVLAHDAAHYRLFNNRALNDALGRLLMGVAGYSMLTYRITHRLHHNHLYQPNDPDVALHGGYPRGRWYLMRKLAKDLLGLTAYKTYAYFYGAPARNSRDQVSVRPLDDTSARLRGAAKRDRAAVLASQLALLGAVVVTGWWPQYLLYWVLPLVTTVPALLRLRAICEHGAVSDTRSPLTAARTNTAPAWLGWLLFPHNVNYHIEHHLYASIPHYNLPECHRLMTRLGMLDGAEVLPVGRTLRKIFA